MRASTVGLVATIALAAASTSVQTQDRLFKVPQLGETPSDSGQQSQPFGPSPKRPNLSVTIPLRDAIVFGPACIRVIPATPEVDPEMLKKAPEDRKYTMRSAPGLPCVSHKTPPAPAPPDAR